MDKTIGYWVEKGFPYLFGIIITYMLFQNWSDLSFLNDSDFLENIVSISSTLFGFLLAVLTLIIQSESDTVSKMKKHGSFSRLIYLNKRTVLASVINCILSFSLSISKEILFKSNIFLLKITESLNVGIFVFVVSNTLIFTVIFYRIIISDQQKKKT